ncbi:hypothetical protein [Streptomyces mooreae]|uniref:hypothetical protein n=1 Tax=Streptomyces mooreae TaxID=3075523 RepID=UPI00374E015F
MVQAPVAVDVHGGVLVGVVGLPAGVAVGGEGEPGGVGAGREVRDVPARQAGAEQGVFAVQRGEVCAVEDEGSSTQWQAPSRPSKAVDRQPKDGPALSSAEPVPMTVSARKVGRGPAESSTENPVPAEESAMSVRGGAGRSGSGGRVG